jgi:hypothetical protein
MRRRCEATIASVLDSITVLLVPECEFIKVNIHNSEDKEKKRGDYPVDEPNRYI